MTLKLSKEHKNLIGSILIAGIGGAFLGTFFTGQYLTNKVNEQLPHLIENVRKEEKPHGVKYFDLNADGKGDVVVYSQNATNIFIQNSLGGYTPFEKYKKDLRDNLDADNRLKSNQLEDSLKEIQTKATEIKSLGAGR